MKIDKNLARQQIQVYGDLLQERAVISEIEQEEVRGSIRYSFTILDTKYPMHVESIGVQNLAALLTSMWATYLKVYSEFVPEIELSSI